MSRFYYIGRLKKGKLPEATAYQLKEFLSSHSGEMIEISIKHHSNDVNLKQKKLYQHFYVEPIAKHSGFSVKDIDAFLCDRFLGYNFNVSEGNLVKEIKDVNSLNTREFADFLIQVSIWAEDNEIPLP